MRIEDVLSLLKYKREVDEFVVNNSLSEVSILNYLYKNKQIQFKELAKGIEVSPSAISQQIKKLMTQGLVASELDSKDKRSQLLSLTRGGEIQLCRLSAMLQSLKEPRRRYATGIK